MSSTGYGPHDQDATVFVSILDRVPAARGSGRPPRNPTPLDVDHEHCVECRSRVPVDRAVAVYAERGDAAIWATSVTQSIAPSSWSR
jgi:hypothetical protein